MEGSGQLYVPANFNPMEGNNVIHCTGGWFGAGNRLDVPAEEKISCPVRIRTTNP
jgi:hypothetical protein